MTMKTAMNSGLQASRPVADETDLALTAVSVTDNLTSIGFTGTRRGMSDDQKGALRIFLGPLRLQEAHHGDALGADAEFHQMVRELLPKTRIVTHPPQDSKYRAFCEGDEERLERPDLTRNKDIMHASGLLIAAPDESDEQRRFDTLSTLRTAREIGVTTLLLLPDGRMILGPIAVETNG